MTAPSLWHVGAEIPADGDVITVAICCQETWTPLIEGLLVGMTAPHFWADNANEEDREYATGEAEKLVASFMTDDCACPSYENGSATMEQDIWDFSAQDHGFTVHADGHGVYQNDVWESVKYQDGLTQYWHSELWIEKAISPTVWPMNLKAYTALNCSSGPTLTFPTLQMILRSNEADPVGSWFCEFNAGYWTQASFRPSFQVQSYRSIKIDLVEFRWHAVANSEAVIDLATCALARMDFDYELPT